MKSNGPHSRAFPVVFVILLALHLAVLSTSRLYPFIDLPNHLAAATINRHYEEAANRFSEYYVVDLFPNPNVFHLLFCSMKIFPSVEFANRIFFCLYAVLLPVAVLLVIGKLGGNRWLSLLSFLCIYNYSVTWGFVGFAFAIPLVLLTFFFGIGYLEHRRTSRLIAVAIVLVFLFFIHVLSALFAFLVFVMCFVFSQPKSFERLLCVFAAAVPLALLIVVWWTSRTSSYRGVGIPRYLADYYTSEYAATILDRKSVIFLDNAHLFEGGKGIAAGTLFSLCIIIPAVILAFRSKSTGNETPGQTTRNSTALKTKTTGITEAARSKRYAIAFLVSSCVCFFVLPRGIPQQSILYQRFSVFLLLSVVILAGLFAATRVSRLGASSVCAVCIAHLVFSAGYFIEFNRENESLTGTFFPDGSTGRTLSGLIYDFRYRGSPVYIHFPSYYITWSRGVACTKIVDYRFSVVRRNVSLRKLPRYLEWAGSFGNYDGRYRNIDYLLIRGEQEGGAPNHTKGFSEVKNAGEWALYENEVAKTFDNR